MAVNGMAMMLRSMGVDLPAIQKQVEGTVKELVTVAKTINETLARIEGKLDNMNERVTALESERKNVRR